MRQWKNTKEVLRWFRGLKNKKRKSFILFGICSFYPSISEELLLEALNWAMMYVNITPEEKNIIMQAKKSYLYTGKTPWVKKGEKNFDVGMGAWDGAESCDIVGLYLLDQLRNRIKELETGIYRDDALGLLKQLLETLKRSDKKLLKL